MPIKQPTDRLAGRKKPQRHKIPIALDSDVAVRYQEVKEDFEMKKNMARRLKDDAQVQREFSAAQADYDRARAEMEDNCQWFTFQALGRKRYDDLCARHPVTPEVKARAIAEGTAEEDANTLAWNPFSFPQAIVQACCVDPVLDDEEIADIFDGDNWNQSEVTELTMAAVMVNTSRRIVELGKG